MHLKLKTVFILLFVSIISFGQQTQTTEVYNGDFIWTMEIPDHFRKISQEREDKIQEKGTEIMEETLGMSIINQSVTSAYYDIDDFNSIEVNYQPYDEAELAEDFKDYNEYFDAINEVLLYTMLQNMPDSKFQEFRTVEKLGGHDFQAYKVEFSFPNDIKFHTIIYGRAFGDKEFSVNLIYLDEEKGNQLLEVLNSSKFTFTND